jgi:hypothetical protein
MKVDLHYKNCRGCVSLGECEGETVCYNLVHWPDAPVPEYPPCHETPESQETPEYKAYIETIRAVLKARYGVVLPNLKWGGE